MKTNKYPDVHCSRCGSGRNVCRLANKSNVVEFIREHPSSFDFPVPALGDGPVYLCGSTSAPDREGCLFGAFREMFNAARTKYKRRLRFKGMTRVWSREDERWYGPGEDPEYPGWSRDDIYAHKACDPKNWAA